MLVFACDLYSQITNDTIFLTEVLLKESLCIQDNISRVISECVICFEDRGDNFCHQCGVSLCSFCLSKIEQNTKLSCPQCRKEYTRCLDDDFNDERV